MRLDIQQVKSSSDIESVAALAQQIWRQHFPAIIGMPQVEYMLEKFQSVEAINSQLQSGTEYFIAILNNEPVGYTALVPDIENRKIMISKIYILENSRGLGAGSQLLEFIENEARRKSINTLWLTVNRFNDEPITWYKHKGFKTVDEVKKDIGGGFFMDDYIMEKRL
jgi:GNAT superfamily N-acetyltransferase